MSEPLKRSWPWLTLPAAVAILILPLLIAILLAWYFDTVWWHELVHFINSKIIFEPF